VGQLDRLHPEAATALAWVLADRGSLAVSLLGDDEQVVVVAGDVDLDHLVVLAEAHALDAGGRAAHRARALLGEADRLAAARDHQDVVTGARVTDSDEL